MNFCGNPFQSFGHRGLRLEEGGCGVCLGVRADIRAAIRAAVGPAGRAAWSRRGRCSVSDGCAGSGRHTVWSIPGLEYSGVGVFQGRNIPGEWSWPRAGQHLCAVLDWQVPEVGRRKRQASGSDFVWDPGHSRTRKRMNQGSLSRSRLSFGGRRVIQRAGDPVYQGDRQWAGRGPSPVPFVF